MRCQGVLAAILPPPQPEGGEGIQGGCGAGLWALQPPAPSYFFGKQLAHISMAEELGLEVGPWASV